MRKRHLRVAWIAAIALALAVIAGAWAPVSCVGRDDARPDAVLESPSGAGHGGMAHAAQPAGAAHGEAPVRGARIRNVAVLTGLSVAFGAFAVLPLLYFFLERDDRVNLAFGGYAGSLSGIFAVQLRRELLVGTGVDEGMVGLLVPILLAVLGVSLVAFVAASRRRPVPKAAWGLAVAHAVVALASGPTDPHWLGWLDAVLLLGLVALALVEALRSRLDAMQGRWPLVVSTIAGSAPLAVAALDRIGVPLAASSILLLAQGALALVLVLASIGQASRFAVTNRQLQAQLARVREMAARERERDRAEAEAEAARERERADAERQARELEEARAFQLSLLPSRLDRLAGWEAVASMRTATEVGGDYFDVRRQADGTATLVIGDATGHGLRAGTLVATTKGLFQAVGDHEDLGAALQVMGQALRDLRLRGLFMALTIVRLFPDGRVALANAGMPPAVRLALDGSTTSLGVPAPPLGAPIRFDYAVETHALRPGDRLFLMSDGVPERMGTDGELFGYASVPGLLRAQAHLGGDACVRALEAALDAWAGRPPDDDATWLVITRT